MATAVEDRKATAERANGHRLHRRGVVGRISTGHLVMVVSGLAGLVLTLSLLRGADAHVEVAVAARDLPAGSVFDESDVRSASVQMDGAVLRTVLSMGDVSAHRGSVSAVAIEEGELIARRSLRPVAARAGQRAMSFPIDVARAVNGELAAGDRVDVLVATEQDVAIVVADAEVLDVRGGGEGGAFGATADEFSVMLAVDVEESQMLTAAAVDGDVFMTRTTGSEPATGVPPLPIDRDTGAR